jgi:hypothetical protein
MRQRFGSIKFVGLVIFFFMILVVAGNTIAQTSQDSIQKLNSTDLPQKTFKKISIQPSSVIFPEDRTYSFSIFGSNFNALKKKKLNIFITLIADEFSDNFVDSLFTNSTKAFCTTMRNNDSTRVVDLSQYLVIKNDNVIDCSKIPKILIKSNISGVWSYKMNQILIYSDTTNLFKSKLLFFGHNEKPIRIFLSILLLLPVVIVFMLILKKNKFFIDQTTNTISLSTCQLTLWLVTSFFSYVYLFASKVIYQGQSTFTELPDGLLAIVGVSLGTSVAASGIINAIGSKGAGDPKPSIKDLITSGGIVAPERLQFVLWTCFSIVFYVFFVLRQNPITISGLPTIPSTFWELMGISSLGYIGGKLARKPGPNIQQISLIETAGTKQLKLNGVNLSSNVTFSVLSRVSPEKHIDINSALNIPASLNTDKLPNELSVVINIQKINELLSTNQIPSDVVTLSVTVTNPDSQKATKEIKYTADGQNKFKLL